MLALKYSLSGRNKESRGSCNTVTLAQLNSVFTYDTIFDLVHPDKFNWQKKNGNWCHIAKYGAAE